MTSIVPFETLTGDGREAAARLLQEVFGPIGGWQTIEEAREESDSFLSGEDRRAWAALDNDAVIGWIGRIIHYSGNVWELHPMLVAPARQRQGIGRRLVERLEAEALAANVWTIQLGADDETGGTNATGVDLYRDIWAHMRDLEQTERGHQIGFYRALGYEVSGLVPDANGFGRPDIMMAKRIRPVPGPASP